MNAIKLHKTSEQKRKDLTTFRIVQTNLFIIAIRLIACWTAYLTMAASCAEPSKAITNLIAGQDQTIIAYGTSLTEKGAWVSYLETWLNNQGYKGKATVLNKGLSGSTSQSHGVKDLERDVIAHSPSTVLIEFGMNDCIQRLADPSAQPPRMTDAPVAVPLDRFKENLSSMISEIRRALPDAEIFLLTMNTAFDSAQTPNSGRYRKALPDYYAALKEVGANEKVPVIDTYEDWLLLAEKNPEDVKKLIPDGVHPNSEGSTLITLPRVIKTLQGGQ